MRLFDAHCHLDFMSNMAEVARDAEARGLGFLAMGVDPRDYEGTSAALGRDANVRVAVGLHPWWVADGRSGPDEVALATRLAARCRFVGEVGMDLSPRHVPEGSHDRQREALERVCAAVAETSDASAPKVISIHSARSASEVLGVLKETGCLERCRCIFHWFSGTSDELHRAVTSGCWFSVNEMMLRTRRGREYARQMPPDRLLTETDLPPQQGEPFSAAEVAESLERCIAGVAQARGMKVDELTATIAENSARLLS